MLSRFPFLSCWATQVCSKSVLGGNSIIKQQVRGLVSQVNSHARWRAFTTDSHSPPSVSDLLPLHGQGSRHRTADTWPKHSCPSWGLWGPASCVRRHFMAAITFFLVVNTTVEAQSRITAPRHSAPSNRVVTPLLVFSLHSGELPNCAPVTALHSRVTEQANGAATFQMTNSILCEVSL